MDENYTRNKIKALMNERGTTIQQLADALNISQFVIYHWFNRGSKSFMSKLGSIAEYFNVSTDYLTGHELDASIDSEVNECTSILKARPELREFIRTAKDSSKADVEVATQTLAALNQRKG